MKKEELIQQLQKMPEGVEVCIHDYRKTLHHHHRGEEETGAGIEEEFKVVHYGDNDGVNKPFIALEYVNKDYQEGGQPNYSSSIVEDILTPLQKKYNKGVERFKKAIPMFKEGNKIEMSKLNYEMDKKFNAGIDLKVKCPNCGGQNSIVEPNYYLMYPVTNEVHNATCTCTHCEAQLSMPVILRIGLEYNEDDLEFEVY